MSWDIDYFSKYLICEKVYFSVWSSYLSSYLIPFIFLFALVNYFYTFSYMVQWQCTFLLHGIEITASAVGKAAPFLRQGHLTCGGVTVV